MPKPCLDFVNVVVGGWGELHERIGVGAKPRERGWLRWFGWEGSWLLYPSRMQPSACKCGKADAVWICYVRCRTVLLLSAYSLGNLASENLLFDRRCLCCCYILLSQCWTARLPQSHGLLVGQHICTSSGLLCSLQFLLYVKCCDQLRVIWVLRIIDRVLLHFPSFGQGVRDTLPKDDCSFDSSSHSIQWNTLMWRYDAQRRQLVWHSMVSVAACSVSSHRPRSGRNLTVRLEMLLLCGTSGSWI